MMNFKKLRSKNEDIRRFEIIDISKSSNVNAIDSLLNIYHGETIENKRHIIRAYGNIGGSILEKELASLLKSETGIVLGDLCKSIGQLNLISLKKDIQILTNHDLQWVHQNANWALKEFQKM